jgi:signal transduction histidine kinase
MGATEPDAPVLRRARLRLLLWSGGTTLVLLATLGISLYAITAASLRRASEAELTDRANRFTQVAALVPARLFSLLPVGISLGGPNSGTIALVVDQNGVVHGFADRPEALPDRSAIEAARASGSDLRVITIDGVQFRVLTKTVSAQDSTITLQVVTDISDETRTLQTMAAVLVFGGLAILLGALAVGWVYSSRAMVPIRDSLRRQRQFAADASHELRTPLAIIRATVDDLRAAPGSADPDVRAGLDDIVAETEHLSALVADLLVLARVDSSAIEIEKADVDLAAIAGSAVDGLRAVAQDRDVRLTFDGTGGPMVGDAVRLRQLVTILVENGIRHTPGGGTVATAVAADNGAVMLRVEDDGPGIPPDQIDRVFDRFWRGTSPQSHGTGLGLAIAAWIVTRHGGSIQAGNRERAGARFVVRLPVRPDEA